MIRGLGLELGRRGLAGNETDALDLALVVESDDTDVVAGVGLLKNLARVGASERREPAFQQPSRPSLGEAIN
ncbi:hypothetical protein ACLOJK_001341 [Asimina triloba]